MKFLKNLLIFSFVFLLLFTSFNMAQPKNELNGYEEYYGKIVEVNSGDKFTQILVENEDAENTGFEKLYLYTDNVPILDLKTGKFIKEHKFKNGELIQYFFRKDTPILESLPAKLSPNIIAINYEEGEYSLDVDTYDTKGNGVSNRLRINLSKDTIFVNLKGEKINSVKNGDFVVLYKVATMSLPPITNPDKIIVLDAKEKTITMTDYMDESGELVYLRNYYEALGADVKWIKKGSNTKTLISINNKVVEIDNNSSYKIGDMIVDTSTFPVKNGMTLIPTKFIKEINNYLLAEEK